jgi:hypothetical protein
MKIMVIESENIIFFLLYCPEFFIEAKAFSIFKPFLLRQKGSLYFSLAIHGKLRTSNRLDVPLFKALCRGCL